ncbi:MAG: outer membrane protein [Pseudomonadales bacterium]
MSLIVCLLASSAYADDGYDWYVSAALGWDYADSVSFAQSNAKLDFDRGRYLPAAAIGLQVGENWRFELDASLRRNTPEILYAADAGIEIDPDSDDAIEASSVMLNVQHEIPVGIAWRPYIGAGIGVTSLDYRLSEITVDGPFFQRPRRDIVNDRTTAFAYQFILGFTVPVTRRFDLAADYRYWRAPSPDLEDVTGADLNVDHTVHSAWLHLRYHQPSARLHNASPPGQNLRQGLYIKSSIGGGIYEDANVEGMDLGIDAFDLGQSATLAVGYVWRRNWQLELETAYRKSDVEVIDFRPDQGEDPASGRVASYSLMANVMYQFRPRSTIRPYVGFGIGIVRSSFDINVFGICESFVCGTERRAELIDDNDSAQVAQVMFGTDVTLSPRTTFFADYRYWVTSDFEDLQQSNGSPFLTYLRHNSIMVGFRYLFGAQT